MHSIIILFFAFLPWLILIFLHSRKYLHILQLEEYENARLWHWAYIDKSHLFHQNELSISLILILFSSLFVIKCNFFNPYSVYISLLFFLGGFLALYLHLKALSKEKKPLKFTARASRLFISAILIEYVIILLFIFIYYLRQVPFLYTLAFIFAAIVIINQASIFFIILGNSIMLPLEHSFHKAYLKDAKRILKEYKPQIIGITGSYGKTSTKMISAAILNQKFITLPTPASYNTLMGVCRVIRENLSKKDKIFIAEMGAYRRGSIKKLCDLVEPEIGILTAIGPQHLERFGTLENIRLAKSELLEALPKNGIAIINFNDINCREAAQNFPNLNIIRYGIIEKDCENREINLDVYAKDIHITSEGCSFHIINVLTDIALDVKTKLLGRHNILNILAAVALAGKLNISDKQIQDAISKLQPIEHRLQLLANKNNIHIIDDAFNSNPVGAKNALEVLKQFEGNKKGKKGKKILITPGMVELGDIQEEENYKFGKLAADACDYVILVGLGSASKKSTIEQIKRGLLENNFSSNNIYLLANIEEATKQLQNIVRANDIVLFENDLSDNYL